MDKPTGLSVTPSPAMPDSRGDPLDRDRITKAKVSYNARNIPLDIARFLLQGNVQPKAGDLVLARILSIGQHQRLELPSGRRAGLHVGDEVIVCYGARYAPDQFEAYVPDSLEACHLVAAGGIAAKSISRHRRVKAATAIMPVGLLADGRGKPINLKDWPVVKPVSCKPKRPFTVAVVGSSMNAGKTTTAAGVIHALKQRGLSVGATKVTGTGAGGDRWKMIDAGADQVLDFTDAGLASTFGVNKRVLASTFRCLIDNLALARSDVIVVEVADGLFQKETDALLSSGIFKASVDTLIFAARESLAAKAGVDSLRRRGFPISAVSGAINASPLARREAETVIDLPLLMPEEAGDLLYEQFQMTRASRQSDATVNVLSCAQR